MHETVNRRRQNMTEEVKGGIQTEIGAIQSERRLVTVWTKSTEAREMKGACDDK